MRHTSTRPGEVGPGPAPPLGELLRAVLWRRLLVLACICTAIGLLLGTLDRGSLGINLIYSYVIGGCCWLFIDGSRLALAAALEHRRRSRGEPWKTRPLALGWMTALPLALIGMLLGPSLGLTLGDAITGYRTPSLWQLDSLSSRLTLLLTVSATAVSVLVGSLQERLRTEQLHAEAARLAQAESQLRLLQSQLEPHMLFNTLANLRVLIGLDPMRAQDMLDRLIAFLRATLQASRAERHPLSAEFERLADYLALMQVRMGARLQVQLDLPDPLASLEVPPLILQPLVENSVLHGLEPKVGGGRIAVAARRDGDRLVLSVTDTGVGLRDATDSASGSTGFGLEQVRRRLATLYGNRAAFTLQSGVDGCGAVACIELPSDTGRGTRP